MHYKKKAQSGFEQKKCIEHYIDLPMHFKWWLMHYQTLSVMKVVPSKF